MKTSTEKKDSLMGYKIGFTVVALAIFAGRIFFPNLKIDVVSLGLLAFAILPWLAPLIKSAELPGVGKIEFRDVRDAAVKVTGGENVGPAAASRGAEQLYISIADQDPRLALVGLRIEIEKRLRELAELTDARKNQPLISLTRELERKEILHPASAVGLRELIFYGNEAAHGAAVSADVAASAVEYGPNVLAILDAKLAELKRTDESEPR